MGDNRSKIAWFNRSNRIKISYEIKYFCVVFLLLCLPLALSILSKTTDMSLDTRLAGNFDTYTEPEFKVEDFASGTYQKSFESWWNENFVSRGYIISGYNQLRYSLFGLGNRIIGKGNSIYEDSYLADVFGLYIQQDFSYPENQAAMRIYVEQLESISENLKLLGKEFLVYTTMSKAAECPDQIPAKYRIKYGDRNNVRAIDYFRSIIGEYEVLYLDSREVMERIEPDYPVFYKTGIHWSRPMEQEVSREILAILREAGVDVGTFELKSLKESDKPYWRDADVYDVLNIYHGTTDPVYYEYETSIEETGTANLLIQGGSFGLGLKKDFIENLAGAGIINIFYNQYLETPATKTVYSDWNNLTFPFYLEHEGKTFIGVESNYMDTPIGADFKEKLYGAYAGQLDGSRTPIKSWDELDFARYIEQADAVIIEVNEHSLYAYSNGFVEHLYNFLENYVEDIRESMAIANKAEYAGNLQYGFHDLETDYRWTEGEARIKFYDPDIVHSGLEMEFYIPEELDRTGYVTVVLNGTLEKKIPLANAGKNVITFSPEELQGTDWYDIVITSSDSFVPMEKGWGADTRELAVRIYYIGEKR